LSIFFAIKPWEDEAGLTHVLLVNGYAASAEAIQSTSLAKILYLNIQSENHLAS